MVSPLSLSLSPFPNGHCMCAGYLTYTISPAGLIALHRCRLSHLYNINSLAFSVPFSSLSLFPNGHCMCAGYLTHTISPAGLIALHRCRLSHLHNINSLVFSFHSPLSLSSQMAIVCVQAISHIQYCQLGSLHYIGAGYLTYIISTALLSPPILLSLFSGNHGIFTPNFVGWCGEKVLLSMYSLLPCHELICIAIGSYLLSYRDFYLFSYRIVGIKSDGNCCLAYCLPQLPHHAPGV